MKTILSVLGMTCLAAMTVLSGCGDSVGGTCGNTPACGGDLVGTWTIASSCVSAGSSMSALCPGATADTANLKVTGTITYTADMTYTTNSVLSGSETLVLPLSCFVQSDVSATCDQLGQIYMNDPTNQSATCTGSSICTCTIVLSNQTSTRTGTYSTTAAGLATDTPTGGAPSQSDYCVRGQTLTLSPHAGAGIMGQSVTGTITLTRS
jgi:hypothetical protein